MIVRNSFAFVNSRADAYTKINMEKTKAGAGAGYNWISDFVYGGIDGSVTTFAAVAGVAGAQLPVSIVLIMGFANLLADGVSMSVGKYSSDKAEKQRIQKIRRLEYQSIQEKPEEEIAEIEEILRHHGFTGQALASAVNVITHNKDAWVELMMKYEFNVVEEAIYPLRSAVTTFIAFNVVGLIPLLGYLFMPILKLNAGQVFFVTCIFTMIALFIVGAVKSRVTDEAWWKSGSKTLLAGGVAASLAYVVGYFLRDIV